RQPAHDQAPRSDQRPGHARRGREDRYLIYNTTMMSKAPETAQIVRVRQRQYLVEDVVPPAAGDDATLVRMSCLDDDAQGQRLEVLWEKEVDPEPINAESWQEIASRGFDPPKRFSAYLHTLQWNCVTATDPNLFQAPFRAGIRI